MSDPLGSKEQEILDALLVEAVRAGDLEHVRLYVSRGASVHKETNFRQSWVRNGAGYSSSVSGPLFHLLCAERFSQPVADFLIGQGADVDARDSNGNTPLMMAAKAGNLGHAAYLLSKGADPLAANKAGEIALDVARGLGQNWHGNRQQIIDALVKALPEVEARREAREAAAEEKSVPPQETAQETALSAAGPIVAPKTARFGQKRRPGGFRL